MMYSMRVQATGRWYLLDSSSMNETQRASFLRTSQDMRGYVTVRRFNGKEADFLRKHGACSCKLRWSKNTDEWVDSDGFGLFNAHAL